MSYLTKMWLPFSGSAIRGLAVPLTQGPGMP